MDQVGWPRATSTSTSTGWASTPMTAAEWTETSMSHARSASCGDHHLDDARIVERTQPTNCLKLPAARHHAT